MKAWFRISIILVVICALFVPFIPVAAQGVGDPGLAAPPMVQVTPDFLALVAGSVLSLAFSYIPGLNTKFASIDPVYKRLIMLLLLLIVAGAIYGLGCGGIVSTGISCDRNGVIQLIWLFILSIIANQSTYTLTPQTEGVKAARQP